MFCGYFITFTDIVDGRYLVMEDVNVIIDSFCLGLLLSAFEFFYEGLCNILGRLKLGIVIADFFEIRNNVDQIL